MCACVGLRVCDACVYVCVCVYGVFVDMYFCVQMPVGVCIYIYLCVCVYVYGMYMYLYLYLYM